MPKTITSICEDSVPNWTLAEGLREVMQEYLDASTEGYSATAEFLPSEKLRITILGKVLEPKMLRHGHSDKRDNSALVGEHGHGFVDACVVLTRLGKTVWVKTGHAEEFDTGEIWKVGFEHTKQFGAETLVFNRSRASKKFNGTQLEIRGVTQDEWDDIAPNFLAMLPPDERHVMDTHYGRVLKQEKYRNKLFVGGLFVCRLSDNYQYGFDVKPSHMKLSRDRSSVSSWEERWVVRQMLEACYNAEMLTANEILDMIEKEGGEATIFESDYTSTTLSAALATAYEEKYTENGKVPIVVASTREAKQLEHFQQVGRTAHAGIRKIMENNRPSIDSRLRDFGTEVETYVQLGDMTEVERSVLDEVVAVMEDVHNKFSEDQLQIVEFKDKKVLGLYTPDKRMIQIARSRLESIGKFAKTLCHEAAHDWDPAADDGTALHGSLQDLLEEQFIDALLLRRAH